MLKLRLLTGPRAGRQLRISDTKPVSIGRRIGRLRLHDSRVSKHHAEIYYANGLWILRDLDSANGTFINRERAEGLVELEPGDLVQMGRVLIKIVRADGIGMDTHQPMASDDSENAAAGKAMLGPGVDLESLDSDDDAGEASGFASGMSDLTNADEELDLEAIFGESDEREDSDGSVDLGDLDITATAGTSDSQPSVESEPFTEIETDQVVSSGYSALEPKDLLDAEDEPSFDPADEADEFSIEGDAGYGLSTRSEAEGDEPSPAEASMSDDDSTGDLISLDDGPEHKPEHKPAAGTTIFTPSQDDAGSDEDEGEDKPEVVGLHLGQAAPQQPEIADEDSSPDSHAETACDPSAAVSVPFDQEAAGGVDLEDIDEQEEPEVADAVFKIGEDQPVDLPDDEERSAGNEAEAIEVSSEPGHDLYAPVEDEPGIESHDPQVSPPVAPAGSKRDTADTDDAGNSPMPAFDIDAAFDALSEGLDDSSVNVPAIGSEPEEVDAPTAAVDEKEGADQLAGSQLDVGYIKEALAKLEEKEGQDDRNASAHTPPPGLANPPSSAPSDAGYASKKGKGWFLTGLILLLVGGAGGWLLATNSFQLQAIAGRFTDQDNASDGGKVLDGPITPPDAVSSSTDESPQEPDRDKPIDTTEDQSPALAVKPVDDSSNESPDAPDPFGKGPAVLGSDALAGIGVNSPGSSGLDAPRLPGSRPGGPDDIRQPALPGPGTGKPDTNNQPTIDPETGQIKPAHGQPDKTPGEPSRIVFLVDASGSLVDSMPQMLVWLNEAVQTIGPDEQFALIFFKSGKAIETDPAGLQKPTRQWLSKVKRDWLNPEGAPVLPTGRSDPTVALARALSYNPTDVYLLSDDSFAHHTGDATYDDAVKLVTQTLGDRMVRVHGVQFFYRDKQSALEALADQYNGTFEFVKENVVPDSDPIDLLEELGGEPADENR